MVRRTIEHCSDDRACKTALLLHVYEERNLWCVGVIGPGLVRRVGHGSDACHWGGVPRRGEGDPGRRERELDGKIGVYTEVLEFILVPPV